VDKIKFAVLLPEVDNPSIPGGGHLFTVGFAKLLKEHAEVELVSYNLKEEGVWYLPEVEEKLENEGYVCIITWGPHVNFLLEKYYGKFPLVYLQQSMDWGIKLPIDVPVLCVSKYVMAMAQLEWPSNPQFYMPIVLPEECKNTDQQRDIDVLIVKRKLPEYITQTLRKELEKQCNVYYLDSFVTREELYSLFNRSKTYLYAFDPQRCEHTSSGWRMMEGGSLQALEAMLCGCTVFSDLRGGPIDFVQPWEHGYKLQTHSMQWDIHQILNAVHKFPQIGHAEHEQYIHEHYGIEAFQRRAESFISFISEYTEFIKTHPSDESVFKVKQPFSNAQKRKMKQNKLLVQIKRKLLGRS